MGHWAPEERVKEANHGQKPWNTRTTFYRYLILSKAELSRTFRKFSTSNVNVLINTPILCVYLFIDLDNILMMTIGSGSLWHL